MKIQRARIWLVMLALVLTAAQAGCANHKIARIGPGEWDAATTRVYPAPKEKAFTAAWKYLESVGTVTRAERGAGVIAARVGVTPTDPATGYKEMAALPEYTCSVLPNGRDSSKIALRILNPQEKKGQPLVPVVETARTLYTTALDSIGTFLTPARTPTKKK